MPSQESTHGTPGMAPAIGTHPGTEPADTPNAAGSASKGWLGSLSAKVAALTGLVVLIGGLATSSSDTIKAVLDVRSNLNKTANDALFKKHFKDKPILSTPLPIKSENVAVEMLLEVYEGGDVFIRYGDVQQWFPFKTIKVTEESWFPSAHAGGQFADVLQSLPNNAIVAPVIRQKVSQPRQLTPPPGERKPGTDDPIDASQRPLDLDSVIQQRNLHERSQYAGITNVEKSYVIAEQAKDRSSLFGDAPERFEQTFESEPGFNIASATFRPSSANGWALQGVDVLDGGKKVRISYTLTSGAFLWGSRGWVKGLLQTRQVRTTASKEE